MARKRFLSAKQIQEMLEHSDDDDYEGVASIKNLVVVPPDKVDFLTDEEDCDDDEMPILSSKTIQEVAGAIDVEYNSNEDDFAAPESDCINNQECVSGQSTGKVYKKLSEFGAPVWVKGKKSSTEVVQYGASPCFQNIDVIQKEIVSKLESLSPLELFDTFYNDAIFDLIITESNR
jgi:hypothetical protein